MIGKFKPVSFKAMIQTLVNFGLVTSNHRPSYYSSSWTSELGECGLRSLGTLQLLKIMNQTPKTRKRKERSWVTILKAEMYTGKSGGTRSWVSWQALISIPSVLLLHVSILFAKS
ncbi:hypothetical protein P692DRAFT_20265285 [Suillus brevipes Sb2]|nr:hypothetical protein P692DRAFT_20265285 [Suillus brevipes Sb2]